ncbi:Aste57867_16446 [Aphanomyces stellatus]|uniref:Aste57867_16446 protein n=1 Tax=Aphanomyces stellatus TaxID=120398 RepID=A0A485L5T6_9STRA|nr:hypothetical protein As57867_016389 [Aphanomyces stellatus]VFT93220.1 Aste57867_16446 [Aphanomyces stellatus]
MDSIPAVLHSSTLLQCVFDYQRGIPWVHRAILAWEAFDGLSDEKLRDRRRRIEDSRGRWTYGRVYRRDPSFLDLDDLPAIMRERSRLLDPILESPSTKARLLEAMALHTCLRARVAEVAAYVGDTLLLERMLADTPNWNLMDPQRNVPLSLLPLAASQGHVSTLRLLHQAGMCSDRLVHDAYTDIELAALRDDLACVEYLASQRRPSHIHPEGMCTVYGPYLTGPLDWAAAAGNLPMVNCLMANRAQSSHWAIDHAATNGHLAIVQRLNDAAGKSSTAAMDGAAAHGHLDVVRYLHEHHHMTACTTAAMDDAATAGFDDIVTFLALHRQERGTEQTMAVYAEHGNLERMRWLHAHGVQTYAPRVLNAAASSGHLHVVQYLLDEAHVVGVYLPALNGAAKEGHFDIVKHFLARWADQDVCVAAAMRAAHVAGHDLILDYLDVHRCQCCQEKSRDVVLAKKTAKRRRCR